MSNPDLIARLTAVLEERKAADPQSSYVASLHHKGQDAILKKIGEEAAEVIMASKDQQPNKVVCEVADLWFHCMVLLSHHGVGAQEVLAELGQRMGVSGLQEKASRTHAAPHNTHKE
ncbi:MAG: phosphoribosyl-ATP diphosphatase [Limnobacter sp.]|nr:phosphoribosyl-ATP diphosphatase [Limnobacter sp.]